MGGRHPSLSAQARIPARTPFAQRPFLRAERRGSIGGSDATERRQSRQEPSAQPLTALAPSVLPLRRHLLRGHPPRLCRLFWYSTRPLRPPPPESGWRGSRQPTATWTCGSVAFPLERGAELRRVPVRQFEIVRDGSRNGGWCEMCKKWGWSEVCERWGCEI